MRDATETTPDVVEGGEERGRRARGGAGRRIVVVAASVVLAILILAAGAVFLFTNTDYGRERVRRFALAQIQKQAHGVVRIGRVSGNLLTGLVIDDMSITDSAGAPFFAAERASARYALRPFLSKRVYLDDVRLVRPVIVLDRPPGGKWNFMRIFPGDTTKLASTGPGWGSWLRLTNVELTDGHVVVRTPWTPSDTLSAVKRDSVIRDALGGGSRLAVVRVAGGFQKVSDFRQLFGRFPLLLLADPERKTRRIEVATARMIAEPFRPPVADVRDVNGAFELTSDSLWFSGVRASFPASRLAAGAGHYDFDSGDLRLTARAAPAAFADFRWSYPRFPSEGSGSLDFGMVLLAASSDFIVRNADVAVGQSHLAGDLGFLVGRTVTFHDTKLRFERFDTRLLEQLVPHLKLPVNGLAGGRLAMAGGFDSLDVDADVTFDEARSGRSHLVALGVAGYDTTARGNRILRARDLRLTFAPLQVALGRVFMPTFPVAGQLTGTATVDGSSDRRLTAVAELAHAERGARSRVSGRADIRYGAGAAGAPWVDVDARLRPLSLVTVGRFAPAIGLRGAASGPVRVRGSLGDLAVSAPLTFSEGGGLTVRGRADLASAQKGYDLTAVARLFNAHAIVTKAPATSLTATARARGRGLDPATMRATFAADVQTSSYDSIPVDSARLRASVANGLLRLDSTAVLGPAARALLAGTFGLTRGREGTLAYRVEVDSLGAFTRLLPPADTGAVTPRPGPRALAAARMRADSLRAADAAAVEAAATGRRAVTSVAKRATDSVGVAVRRDSLAGALYAAGVVRGGLPRFDLRGRAAATDVVAYGNSVRRARLEYGWTGARTPRSAVAVGAQLDSASAGGFALDSVDARATWRPSGDGAFTVLVRQGTNQEYTADAEYSLRLDRNEIRWRDLAFRFDTTRWVATRPGAVRWGKSGVEIRALELRSGTAGRVYVNGLVPTEGRGDLQVAIDNFQVGDLISLAQSDVEARGLLSLGLNFEGTTRDPRFRGAFGVLDGDYRGSQLPDLRGTFGYGGARLEGHATASRPGGSQFLTVDGTIPVNLALGGVTGPRLASNAPIVADLVADSLPLELIPRFTDAVSNVGGLAQGVVRVRGTLDHPALAGALSLDRGRVGVVPLGVTLRSMAGSVRLAGDTVVVDSLVGYSGGRLLVRGGLGVKKLTAPSFNLFLVANDLRVLSNERGRLTLNAGLAMSGPYDSAFVSGAVRGVHGVIYIPDPGNKQVIPAGDPAVFAVVDTSVVRDRGLLPAQSPLLAGLRVQVDVDVARDTWVRNQAANVEVYSDGPISVHVDRRQQSMVLNGVMSTERGEYEFLSKRFQIRSGSAIFTGSPELNPLLQITGESEVRLPGQQAFNIQVLIGGTLDQPRITLGSDRQPPLSQSDLLAYLAFGRSSSSLLSLEGTSLSGPGGSSGGLVGSTAEFASTRLAAVALGVLVDQAESGAARSLGADVFNITPADVNSELFRGNAIGFLQGTEIEYGRYFAGSRLYLALQGQLASGVPGAVAQYRGTRGWRLETSYGPRFILTDPTLGPTQPTSTTGVFGLFLIREKRF
ncbi:MAG: translocation/assembly module TamB domain-containing protein [Gemmatimonadaceae bacterium]